jgi:hypothetical protein
VTLESTLETKTTARSTSRSSVTLINSLNDLATRVQAIFAKQNALPITAALLTGAPRVWLALKDQSVFWPDEIYQSIEPAHRVVFGYGLMSWEFRDGARSWLLPGLLSIVLRLGHVFTNRAIVLIVLVKLSMVLAAVAATVAAVRLAEVASGKRAAWLTALLLATFPPLLVLSHRATPEMASAPCLVLAALWGSASATRPRLAGAAAGLAIDFRMQTAPMAVIFFLDFLRRGDRTGARAYAVTTSIGVLFGGILDWFTWGKPFNATIEYMKFTAHGGASTFGVAPPSYYLETLWTSAGPVVLLLALGLLFAGRLVPGPVAAVGAFIACHVAIPHKEFRFMSPVIPLAVALGAIGLVRFAQEALVPRWLSVLAAIACFLGDGAKAAQLTNGDLGMYARQSYATASVWGFGQDASLLLADAGERPDVCGLLTLGLRAGFTGGFSYFHRPVPLLYRHQLCDDTRYANYLIARADGPVPKEYHLLKRRGSEALFRRDGQCEIPADYDYMLEGANDMGIYRAPIRQPNKSELNIEAGTSGSAFQSGWGNGENLGCRPTRWAVGTKSIVAFPLEPLPGTYTFTFTALAYQPTLPQAVTVVLNDKELAHYDLTESWAGYQTLVPPSSLSRGRNTLQFEFARAVHPEGNDRRELAALFGQIALVPVPERVRIDLGTSEGRTFLAAGFSGDEETENRSAVWSDGPRSQIKLSLAGPHEPHVLDVTALAYAPGAPQAVRVRANGDLVGTVEFPASWTQRALVLPAGVVHPGMNTLEFEYESTRRPKDREPQSADGRELAVMFDAIEIAPLRDTSKVDFGTPAAHSVQLDGWSGDERAEGRSVVWSDGPVSRLLLTVAEGKGPRELHFVLRAFQALAGLRVDVLVNGKNVGFLRPTEVWQTLGVPLPAGTLQVGDNVVMLRYERTARPIDALPHSADTRQLAVEVDSVEVVNGGPKDEREPEDEGPPG